MTAVCRAVTPQDLLKAREIGARLKQTIASSGLSQRALARKIGVSQAAISHYCAGKGIPTDEWLERICRESGVSVAWVKDGVGAPPQDPKAIPPAPRPAPGTVGDRLRQIREAYGIPQGEFGAMLQIPRATIASWEVGLSTPKPKTVKDICHKLCIPESWLRTGEGDINLIQSRRESMQMLFERVLSEQGNSFRQRAIFALLALSDAQWLDLERFAKKLFKGGTP